jgi:MFS family permease
MSDRFQNRRHALILSAVMGLVASIGLLYIPDLSFAVANCLLFLLGLGAGGQSVSFAVVRDYNPPQLVGTASGFNNLSVLIGGSIFQPLVGVLLHHSHDLHLVNDVPVYSVTAYQHALWVMPFCYALSLFMALFILKESHPSHT